MEIIRSPECSASLSDTVTPTASSVLLDGGNGTVPLPREDPKRIRTTLLCVYVEKRKIANDRKKHVLALYHTSPLAGSQLLG